MSDGLSVLAWLCALSALPQGLARAESGAPPQATIDCQLADSADRPYAYSFIYDPGQGSMLWVQGNQLLKIERHNGTELLMSYRGDFQDVPANVAYFELNLFSGEAVVSYFRDPTAVEIEQCEKQQTVGCTEPLALTQDAERGYCVFSELETR